MRAEAEEEAVHTMTACVSLITDIGVDCFQFNQIQSWIMASFCPVKRLLCAVFVLVALSLSLSLLLIYYYYYCCCCCWLSSSSLSVLCTNPVADQLHRGICWWVVESSDCLSVRCFSLKQKSSEWRATRRTDGHYKSAVIFIEELVIN